MESFKDHPQLGRFTLRDEGENPMQSIVFDLIFCSQVSGSFAYLFSSTGKTIAIGKVLKIVE